MEGLFALPMKFTPKWSWENIWGAGSLVALVLVPWPLALVTVPHLGDLYSSVPFHTIVLAVVFGAGWGFGGLFFGLGVSSVGLALGTSLIMGLIAIGGSVVPLILLHKDQFSSEPEQNLDHRDSNDGHRTSRLRSRRQFKEREGEGGESKVVIVWLWDRAHLLYRCRLSICVRKFRVDIWRTHRKAGHRSRSRSRNSE